MSTETRDELSRYLHASQALADTASEVEELGRSEAVETYRRQMDLLGRRLQTNPRAFREMFIADGMGAIAAEFRQLELSAEFINTLWNKLLAGNDASLVLMRFIWNLPLGAKRKFIRALDAHLSGRYSVFSGLSEGWPANSSIPPYVREPEDRSADFGLVNQGYLGYLSLGYTQREVDLLVWLEALRDKQCADKPCQLGELLHGRKEPKGGCPVQVHIPDMMQLLGTGHFREAMDLIESINPLPNVTGRVCPQELQCQSVCAHSGKPIEIGQIEWFLPQRERMVNPTGNTSKYAGLPDPWATATRPPIAVVGSGPSGLINAFLLAAEGHPVTIFEAFHRLGGVLRYGIPEFRLPNTLIDDVVEKITALGGKFVTNFVVGKTATLAQLKDAGFAHIFVGSGAGLPRFMNVPGEHLLNVMSANEFLTRVNLMQGHHDDYETPLPYCRGKQVMVIGGGNTAMDAARTARRLGGNVTICYRRTRDEMPARVEELAHALEEGVQLATLRSPSEFLGDDQTGFVKAARLEVMALGEPDASGRRRPVATGETEVVEADLVIMALGNSANPIIKDSEPTLTVTTAGALELTEGSQATSIDGVYSGGDATRGGSTAVKAAGDGQAAAREIRDASLLPAAEIREMVSKAKRFSELAGTTNVVTGRRELGPGIIELEVYAPLIAQAARAGQFVRVLGEPKGELIPLTLADWDAEKGTVVLVIQGMGTSSRKINMLQVGDKLAGIAGPLGMPSELHRVADDQTIVFTAGGVGLPPVYPIAREHLRLGNHVTLIAGFRSADLLFWVGAGERVDALQAEFGDQLEVVYTSNDGSFGIRGFVTVPLKGLLDANQRGEGRPIAEITTIGPPLMMRSVSDLSKPYGVRTIASLNSIMVDATGMCGACMVPVVQDGRLIRKHACIDGPELESHSIDWDKFLPRFNLFKAQEAESRVKNGF